MLNTPFSPWPSFTFQEADAVRDVILSNKVNYWTGQECRLFEKSFASWVGSTHAVALANGTLALDVALLALGIGKGDEVIVTPGLFLPLYRVLLMLVRFRFSPRWIGIPKTSRPRRFAPCSHLARERSSVCILPVGLAIWIQSWP